MNGFNDAPHRQISTATGPTSTPAEHIGRVERVSLLFEAKYVHFRLLACRYLKSMDEAHDVVSLAFENALYHWSTDRFDAIINLDAFLCRSIINYCLNILARKKRFLNVNDLALETMFVTDPMAQFDLEIESLVKLLSKKQRDAFVLFWKGYSHQEIAEELNLSGEGASKSLVYYAKLKLQKLLTELPEFDPDDKGTRNSNRKGGENKAKGAKAATQPSSLSTPRLKDLAAYLKGELTEKHSIQYIRKWFANDRFALDILSGLRIALQKENLIDIEQKLNEDKNKLRERLFGAPEKNILGSEVNNELRASLETNWNSLVGLTDNGENEWLSLLKIDPISVQFWHYSLKPNKDQYNKIMESRKFILDKFQNHIHDGYNAYCVRHGLKKTEDLFITYLIDQDLISPTHLQRYTILKEFEQLCAQNSCPKTQAVDTLANRFRLSERTVWSILREKKGKKK